MKKVGGKSWENIQTFLKMGVCRLLFSVITLSSLYGNQDLSGDSHPFCGFGYTTVTLRYNGLYLNNLFISSQLASITAHWKFFQ